MAETARPGPRGHRARRPARAVATLILLALGAKYADWLLGPSGGQSVLFDIVLHDALMFAAAGLCLVGVRRGGHERAAWGCFAAALALYAAGELTWSVFHGDDAEPPFPSVADGFWLAFYPLAYAGLVLMVRGRVRSFSRSLWLDGLVGGLTVSALAAALAFEPILRSTGGDPAAVAVNLAYPFGDLLLLALMVGVFALTGWRPGRSWLLLGSGLMLNGITDVLYCYQASAGTYVEGSLVDQLFPTAALLMGAAALQPARTARLQLDATRMLVVPVGFAAVALGLLAYDHVAGLGDLAFGLALAAIAAGGARAVLLFRENAAMLVAAREDSLTDALTGLGNRRKLLADLEAGLAHGEGDGGRALVLFDLDGFKRYNDYYGHLAGDALLVRLGRNLAGVVSSFGEAYRLGGDEFCMLVSTDDSALETLVDVGAAALCEQGEGFLICSSHGAVKIPAEAATAPDALRLADQRMYAHKHRRASGAGMQSRDVLLRALHERQPDLQVHLRDVTDLALRVGRRLGMGAEALDELARAAELHDVGKVAIPDAILQKTGPLSPEEWTFVRRHPLIGERILAAAPALRPVARLVRSSHERWDGAGYPDGLAGEAIPLGARVVAVCDAFSAMVSDRPYRAGMGVDSALAELGRCSGTQFDPEVVEAFQAEAAAVMAEDGRTLGAAPATAPPR